MSAFIWETYDLYGTAANLPYAKTGSFSDQYNAQKDTAQSGTDDWNVDQGLSVNSCTTTMCTWNCTVYRPLQTLDTKDIQFTVGDTYYATAGFKKFTTASGTNQATKGTSPSPYTAFTLVTAS